VTSGANISGTIAGDKLKIFLEIEGQILLVLKVHPVYISYESSSELDVQDFQEHATEPYPLFINEDYHEEINQE
jgi:hypothetical protein